MHKPESAQKNETHKILWDFEIQTDHLIPARRPELLQKREPADHRVKIKENEKRDKYLDLARELEKLWNMKATMIPIVNGVLRIIPKGLVRGMEALEIGGRAETIIE